MPKADTSVKYFHSEMPGAPVISGTAGALIAALDACLINGFGLKTVDSLVVAGNVATANISTGHSAEKDTVVLIAGATPAELNGEWKVASTTTTTIKFVTSGILDQTAVGTITLKLAPAGWAKPYSGTNLAVYKSTDVTSTGGFVRVDDTATTFAKAVGYESMTDINTGAGPFPSVAQKATGLWWQKSESANATSRRWVMVTDGKLFYFNVGYISTMPDLLQYCVFGDPISTKSGDPYHCMIFGHPVLNNGTPTAAYQYPNSIAISGCNYLARSYTGLGTSMELDRSYPSLNITSGMSGAFGIPYPNAPDGGLYLSPHYLGETASKVLRAISPGFYCVPQVVTGAFVTKDEVKGVAGLPGKTLKAVQSYYTSVPNNMTAFFDVTGPWR